MAKQILGKVVPIAKGEYNSSTQYEILDIVTHNGSSYIAKTNVQGQTPTNTTYWQLLAKVGDKPVYGVDYLTEQEMNAIVNDIITDSTNTFNQNVTTKTNDFNINATNKTNTFNQNATDKTTTFNNNASTKTTNFNSNASDKTTDFNSNATTKTTAFNENAQTKTNDFNTNATSSTGDFDRNATAKTETYNSNASSKVSAYDENHATKMEAYNANDTTKTTAYNNNASAKTTAFNENYQEKLDDFNSHVEDYDARITLNSNRIQHIETDLFDSGNATGSSINLTDSTLAEFIDITEDGVANQITTTGKNLFDKDNANVLNASFASELKINASPSARTLWISCQSNTSYTISKIQSYRFRIATSSVEPVIGGSTTSFTYDDTATSITITTGNSDEYLLVYYYLNGSDTLTEQQVLDSIQIEEGPATPYEPYTGGEPSPSPDYPQPVSVLSGTHNIIVTGKNLLNPIDNNRIGTTYGNVQIKNENGNLVLNGTSSGEFDITLLNSIYNSNIFNKMNTDYGKYCFSNDANLDYYFKVNGSFLPVNTNVTTSALNQINLLIVRIPSGKVFNNTILHLQLEKSQSVTEYEPFGTTTEIEIPTGQFLGKIDNTYKDQIRIAYDEEDGEYHLYLDKKVGKIVLDGTTNSIVTKSGTSANNLFFSSDIDDIQKPTDNNGIISLISNQFIKTSVNNLYINNALGIAVQTGTGKIGLGMTLQSSNDTIELINNWLSTHNTIVYYPLAIPTTTDLGVIEMPTTYYPVTNIFTDSELQPLLKVNYYRDFKTTIQTMQNNITTLQNSMVTLTQAEYDALPTKDSNVYYFIEEDNTPLLTSSLNLNRSILQQPQTLDLDNSEDLIEEEQPIDDVEFIEEREL